MVVTDVFVKDATKKMAWGKWLNEGQTCVAPDCLFVHEKVKDPFVSLLQKEAELLYREENSYTRIISDDHYHRLSKWREEAVVAGPELTYEAGSNEKTRRMGPSIVEDASEGTHVLHDNEEYGPICMIKTFSNIREAINLVKSRPKVLSAYIFARNNKVVEQFKRQTSAGSFSVKESVLQFGRPSMPFGAVNNSGIGKSHGKHGFLAFSDQKSERTIKYSLL